MTATFALEHLYCAVKQRFVDEATPIVNLFGFRSRAQKLENGTRVCWIPGDENGAIGPLVAARYPGRNPRPLATLDELFTCEIASADDSNETDELAQYKATREAFDAWWRACYLAYTGRVRIVKAAWVAPERISFRHGLCIQAVCALDSMIPDVALGAAAATKVGLTVTELDNTETVDVTPEV